MLLLTATALEVFHTDEWAIVVRIQYAQLSEF